MTASVPFQFTQNATVVLAAAAVETPRPTTSIAPPEKLAALQVSPLGTLAGTPPKSPYR